LEFPAGAVSVDTEITIRMVDETQFIFELLPHGIQFETTVTMKLHLDQTTAAGNLVGNSIVWYDDFGNVWKILPTTPIDATTVKTDLMHFSKYGDVGG
jgi:S-adenosylmethionine hydrolase